MPTIKPENWSVLASSLRRLLDVEGNRVFAAQVYQSFLEGQPEAHIQPVYAQLHLIISRSWNMWERKQAASLLETMENYGLLEGLNRTQPKGAASPPKGAFSLSNAGRFDWEKNDCAVRALALAKGLPYAQAHEALRAAGRKDRQGTYERSMSKALGQPMVPSFGRYRGTRPTYAQWLREHPKGIYIVFVTGHFFAVVNGQQIDMAPSLYRPRSRMWGHWDIA